MIEKLNHSIAKLAFFSTFVMVSITLGGLFFFDTYLKAFGYDLTFVELDFYTLFIQVLIFDKFTVTKYLAAVVTVFVMIAFFPKSFNFMFGIVVFFWLLFQKYILLKFLKLASCILLKLYKFTNKLTFGLLHLFLIKLKDYLKKVMVFLIDKTDSEQKIVQAKLDFGNAFLEFEKSIKWILFGLGLLMIWLFWLISFGNVAKNRADELLKVDYQFKYQMFTIDKPQPINCQLIMKLKTGYLVVVKDPKSGQRVATLFSDNVVEKINFKVDVKS